MKKNEWMNYIDVKIRGLTIKEQLAVLDAIANFYVPELKLQKLRYRIQCPKCGEYYLRRRSRIIEKLEDSDNFEETRQGNETLVTKALVYYRKCPICGAEQEVNRCNVQVCVNGKNPGKISKHPPKVVK